MQYDILFAQKTEDPFFLSIRIPKYVNAITEPPNSYKIHITFKCSQIEKGGRLPPFYIVDTVVQLRSHQHFAGRLVALNNQRPSANPNSLKMYISIHCFIGTK